MLWKSALNGNERPLHDLNRHLTGRVISRPTVLALLAIAGVTARSTPARADMGEMIMDQDPGASINGNVLADRGSMWYPTDPAELQNMVDRFLAVEPPVIPEPPVALIVPHAGYVYSGEAAGRAYAAVRDRAYRRVILLGLSHRVPLQGASVLDVDACETPLGHVPVDREAVDELLKRGFVTSHATAHLEEHSAGNQLPMLQRALGEFGLVEVLIGEMNGNQRSKLAESIRDLVDGETLLVVSTDFTHFGANFGYRPFDENIRENLKALNDFAVRQILEVDLPGWESYLDQTHDTICGRNAVALLLDILQPWDDARGLRVAYDTSGERTGDWNTSVTYASIVFWRESEGLTGEEEATLLAIARASAASWLREGKILEIGEDDYPLTPRLRAPGAAFVTLENEGELRGCIGHVVAMMPLWRSVAQNAVQATRDPRFYGDPVTSDEIDEIDLEISVLTPMRRLLEPRDVEVGRDGLMMVRGEHSGLLLPQIPVEQKWSRNEFLAHTCLKAGLPPDAWREEETEIYRFSARVFGEEEGGEG